MHLDVIARLRADLIAADFTTDAVAQRLGPLASAALHREQALPARRTLAGDDSALGVLLRLFTLGAVEERDLVARAVPGCGVEGLEILGLVEVIGDQVRALLDLRPYGDEGHDWWLISDLGELATGRPLSPGHVLGVGAASATLASWTWRTPVERVLDLGTGCGLQALHAATHASYLIATDVSARALEIAGLNAALNEQSWELRAGDLFVPVADERFDLIVSNPPFVITPRDAGLPTWEYRDGGRRGDALVAEVIEGCARALAPGGVAQMLGNWEIRAGQDWAEVVSGWLEPTGLDALVVQRDVQDVAAYAETWVRDGGHAPGTPAWEQMYAAWLDDFAARGVAEVGFGIITLHKPLTPRTPWRELLEVTGPVASPMGPDIGRQIAARTWLAERDDADLIDVAWTVAPDVTEERHTRPGDPDPAVIQVRQGGGLRHTVRLDTASAALLSVCDGEITAGQALTAIAVLLDRPAGEVRAGVLPILRELVAHGLLVRDGGPES